MDRHFPNGKLFVYECLDAIFIVIQDGSDSLGRSNAFAAGGLIDPGSDAATDSEADEGYFETAHGQMQKVEQKQMHKPTRKQQ